MLVFKGDGGHRNEVLSLSWKPGPQSLLASGERGPPAATPHSTTSTSGAAPRRRFWAVGWRLQPAAFRCRLLAACRALQPCGLITMNLPCPAAGMDNFIKIWSLEPQERTLAASDEWQPGEQVFPATLVTVPTFSTEVGGHAKGGRGTGGPPGMGAKSKGAAASRA